MVSFTSSGSFNKTDAWLRRMSKGDIFKALEGFAQQGVAALEAATPVDTGESRGAWGYTVVKSRGNFIITWTNRHIDATGTPIVIMLQYGHGTGTGGYVQGRDFINPAIRPIFDEISASVWKAVTS